MCNIKNPEDYFRIYMDDILNNIDSTEIPDFEVYADTQLRFAVNNAMLLKARASCRHWWWNNSVCSIDNLRKLRNKALNANDHVSVLNFTAMIAMREY